MPMQPNIHVIQKRIHSASISLNQLIKTRLNVHSFGHECAVRLYLHVCRVTTLLIHYDQENGSFFRKHSTPTEIQVRTVIEVKVASSWISETPTPVEFISVLSEPWNHNSANHPAIHSLQPSLVKSNATTLSTEPETESGNVRTKRPKGTSMATWTHTQTVQSY